MVSEFIETFGIWEEAQPYVNMFANEQEMRLIVKLAERELTLGEIATEMSMSAQAAAEFVRTCYRRNLVDKVEGGGVIRYKSSGFYRFMAYYVQYEDWDEIPVEDRKRINRRYLDEFKQLHLPNIELKMQGLAAENALPNDTVLLLHEVEEMVEAAEIIAVLPCDCRRLGQNCDFPVETCVWLDDGARRALDRGHGRELTTEEALELLRFADRKGLMHTADSAWRERGLHAICNCCACDCYPFTAAQEIGSKGAWPKSRYIAEFNEDICRQCGSCVKRCHFDAFYHDGVTVEVKGKEKLRVQFNPDLCWGCGLCANTCTEKAITMVALGT